MTDWWNNLSLLQQIYFGIGIIATLVAAIQMTLTLVGLGAETPELDFDIEIADTDQSTGIGLFSVQTISAFLLAFGWAGGASLGSGSTALGATIIAVEAGVVAMLAMFFLLKSLLKLQSKGNLNYNSVVGKTATVYVTIPGDGHDGGGQIQVLVQSRLITASARKTSPGAVSPGSKVRIVGMSGPTTYLVDTLENEPEATESGS